MLSSSLREIQEPPPEVAIAAASSITTNEKVSLHFMNGEEFSSYITQIRVNRRKQGVIITELEATESSRITLYIPLDGDTRAYAKVWPR